MDRRLLRSLVPPRDRLGPDPGAGDADLLERYGDCRDERAFEELLTRYGPAVWGVCRRMLSRREDAEDAFQATFVALIRLAESGKRPRNLPGWLVKVAGRVCLDSRRQAGRARRRESAASKPEAEVAVAGPHYDAAYAAFRDEVAALPEALRAAYLVCELGGTPQPQAAVQLGLKPSALSARLTRARQRLEARMAARDLAPAIATVVLAGTATTLAAMPTRLVIAVQTLSANPAVIPTALTALAATGVPLMMTKLKLATLAGMFAVAGTLTLGVGGHLLPGAGAQAPLAAPAPAPGRADDDKPPAPRPPVAPPTPAAEVRRLVDRLQTLRPKAGEDEWASALRDLVRLGTPAVPALIDELDKTTDEFTLRCLYFAARAVGDKRVVPALIRAIPRTLSKPGSDYGYIARDPELLAFMQKHDHSGTKGGTHYDFGRAVTESRAALRHLTGVRHGEEELNFVFLGGSARQQFLQRQQFQRCAERWAGWWKDHWKEFVADERYAEVGLAPLAGALPAGGDGLPRGPGVKLADWHTNWVLQSAQDPKARRVFLDLDTGRQGELPDRFRAAPGHPERIDEIAAWAAEEGYDLMGTEYTAPGDAAPHYVLRGLGLAVWRLDGDRRGSLEADLRGHDPLPTAVRSDGLLARFDAARGRYDPADTATYLFRTREGGSGVIYVGVEVRDDRQQRGTVPSANSELSPVAGYKGRRFAFCLVADEPEKKP